MLETTLINPKQNFSLEAESIIDTCPTIDKTKFREGVMDLEEKIKEMEGSFVGDTDNCPLKHNFSEGVYIREMFLPKNTLITGKIHKYEHTIFLMSGEVLVVTENKGREVLKAPLTIISPAGTKRVLYALTDVVWVNIYPNPTNTKNLEELETMIIASDYNEYEKFIKSKKSKLFKLKQTIIKNLSL